MTTSRYSRQELLPHIGKDGQAVLARSRVAVVGLGALGSIASEILARSGVGYLRLIDHDVVELSNLQRCALYNEADAALATPKVLAATEHLNAINSTLCYEPHVQKVEACNVLELLSNVDLVLDGSDNFAVRYLLNEAASRLHVPWIYTGVLGTRAAVMPVMPEGPCLRCLSPQIPEPGSYPTVATAGVLPSTTRIAATLEATWALKLLLKKPPLEGTAAGTAAAGEIITPPGSTLHTASLIQADIWEPEFEMITVQKDPNCPVCSQHCYTLCNDWSTL